LLSILEKKKDASESSTWALSNFLREINQPKEAVANNNNVIGNGFQ